MALHEDRPLHPSLSEPARKRNLPTWSFLLAASFCLFVAGAASAQHLRRTKVADGEYEIYEQPDVAAKGPFGAVYNFHEVWTVWRMEKGGYQVQGHFASPNGQGTSNPFVVDLSQDLTVLGMKEFANLKWAPDAGPLSCKFLPGELDCASDASAEKQTIDSRTPFANPYGLLWPLSPLSLGEITRWIQAEPSRSAEIDLVTIEQPSSENPVQTKTVHGPLQYLGEETIEAAGVKWPAHKFSVQAASHRQYLIWTSQKGLLLALAVEHAHKNWKKEGMRLARFHSSADF